MSRVYHTFPVNDIVIIKQQMLSWANRFNICCFLDNNDYNAAYHSNECLVGAGSLKVFNPSADFFNSLSSFVLSNNDWLFGHFNYDLKNSIEDGLFSANPDRTCFPGYFLFVPEVVLQLNKNNVTIGVIGRNAEAVFREILKEPVAGEFVAALEVKPRMKQAEYLETVSKLLQHIKHGDCYEINFCQEFFAEGDIDVLSVYHQLNKLSPNPFSCYYKLEDKHLLCASPERYIKKEGNKILSQPIKGTSARNHISAKADNENKRQLFESGKDRSENVMIVDLVRNDLSKVCKEGSVIAEELFGVYSFPHVHQMISTVAGQLKDDVGFAEILRATFPMGSMTGAPKRKVMELVEKYEFSKRGIYSGTVGYISPGKDFDFNVVIRSLVYNAGAAYLSFHTGSAITSHSQPEKEYEECLLKGAAIKKVLEGEIDALQ